VERTVLGDEHLVHQIWMVEQVGGGAGHVDPNDVAEGGQTFEETEWVLAERPQCREP